ncbi:MAG: glycosyltransferase family 2 protein [Synechococcaceae cyanobacterium]|nr:glycosyltransferase family 2 protein [Synechococcaceae cyanobacterium]
MARALIQHLQGLLLSTPVPSWGLGRPERRRRMLALVAVRDEARFLPGFLRNVAAHVEGIIALDDGSTDGSDRLLADHPAVLELLRNPPDRPRWDESGNHRRLVDAALRHGAGWMLCLDADERLERHFRIRAERVISRGALLGLSAYALELRELWDGPSQVRVDGLWGGRLRARLFRACADSSFDARELHGQKAPLQGRRWGRYPRADLIFYHLRMVRPQDRQARRARYERLDPDRRWQSIGYDYLTDSTGLRLRPLPPGRDFVD